LSFLPFTSLLLIPSSCLWYNYCTMDKTEVPWQGGFPARCSQILYIKVIQTHSRTVRDAHWFVIASYIVLHTTIHHQRAVGVYSRLVPVIIGEYVLYSTTVSMFILGICATLSVSCSFNDFVMVCHVIDIAAMSTGGVSGICVCL
jgi:hypothetical protein